MTEGALPKDKLLASGREASAPAAKRDAKRQNPLALSRHRLAAYCAHAPEPYAAMASRGDWSTKLWDIFGQPGGANMCCLSLWCPCIQYGLILEQLPPGSVTCAGSVAGGCALFCALWLLGDVLGTALLTKYVMLPCSALVHCQTRGFIRRKYGIQSHPLHDFFITWCCMPCALCQEAREIVVREAAEREGTSPSSRALGPARNGSLHAGDRHSKAGTGGKAAGAAGAPAGAAGSPAAGSPGPGMELVSRGPLPGGAGGAGAEAAALVQATVAAGHPHISTLSLGAGVAVVHTHTLPPEARAANSCATVTPSGSPGPAGLLPGAGVHAACTVTGAAGAGGTVDERETVKTTKS